MKLVLTGAAGFIGSGYLSKLNSLGIDDVLAVDVKEHAQSANLAAKKLRGFLSREELLARLDDGSLNSIDGIVHLGACADTTERDWDYLRRNNLEYSQTLARWCLAHGKFFHYASSASVYGDGKNGYNDADDKLASYVPLNLYGRSKYDFDAWAIREGLTGKIVGFRYFNVFGPNEYHKGDMRSMVSKAYDQLEAGGRVKLFASSRPGKENGSEERDFIYVKDACDVMAWFLENRNAHGIFNVGTGTARSFKDLVTAVFTALRKPPAIEWIPMPEKLRGQYQYFTQADLRKLRHAGYAKPFTKLEDAVADYTVNYLARGRKTL